MSGKTDKKLTGNMLKMIAMLSMLIDHTTVALLEKGYWVVKKYPLQEMSLYSAVGRTYLSVYLDTILRGIGRIAFFLFCFLLVEGFLHTKSREKYLLRMGIFALISEVPFDLVVSYKTVYFQYQNVYFTLALGLLSLIVFQRIETMRWKEKQERKQLILGVTAILLMMVLAVLIHTDYSAFGILLILVLYRYRRQARERAFYGVLSLVPMNPLEVMGFFSFLLIGRYNGERGRNSTVLKYAFYVFYPAHLALLAGIRYYLFGIL